MSSVSNAAAAVADASAASTTTTTPSMSDTVSLGAGCYWGTEKFIKSDFQKRFPNSLKTARVGFMSPEEDHPKNPSYNAVCTGRTGHVEVLNIELNDPDTHFRELIKFFFFFHDPTTKDKQGNDAGTQYASAIFVRDEEQKRIVNEVIDELQQSLNHAKKSPFSGTKMVTAVHDATTFFDADEAHQEYLMKNPSGYCNHYMRMQKWPENDAENVDKKEKKKWFNR